MAKPNFTTRPVAPPPAGGPKHDPSGPPLRHGAAYMADDTSNQLQMVGWTPGDKIPDGLADVVATVAAKYAGAREEVAVVGGTTRLKPVKSVRMEDLPPEAREEITRFVKQAAEFDRAQQADTAARAKYAAPNASDSVKEALEQAALRESAGVQLVDEDAPTAPTAQAAPAAEAELEHNHTPDGRTPVICPRCAFDLRQPYDIVITDDDHMAWAAATLDMTPGSRFRKKLELMGGKRSIVFRDLTTKETKLAFTQTRRDAVAGKISGEIECHMTLMEYRMTMSIESISDDKGAVLVEVPPIFDIPLDPAEADNRLPRLVEYMDVEAYPREAFKKSIFTHFRQFQRLVAELEAKQADPDFCQGIATSLSW